MASTSSAPPYYVLASHNTLQSGASAQSTSSQFALSGLKVSQATGASTDEDKNPNMYVLQVTSIGVDPSQYAS
ncbi:hypothetical protein EDC04DRAFT_2917802 [Pisolithus marmoratus]|nr:hypothetical protein EDC04DRAFT_2917802 [Pisolithus marmoratus]